MRKLLRTGAKASGNGLLTQAPPNTGAGWHTLATGAWPGVSGATQQHLPHQRPAVRQPRRRPRPGDPPGRVDRPVRRARRQEGRADRVGRRARRGDRRADDRLPQLPLGPRRGHELRLPRRLREVHRVVRAPVRPSGRVRRPARVRGRRAGRRDRLDRRPGVVQPGAARCACACSTAASTSTASTPTSTTAATTAGRATTASCSRRRRTATTASATCARASGPTSR